MSRQWNREWNRLQEKEEEVSVINHSYKDPRNSWLHKYNPLSRIYFCWLDPLLFRGCKNTLTEDDLYVYPKEAGSKLLLETFERYWKMEKEKKSPKMWLAIFKCFYWRFFLHGFVSLVLATAVVCQSLLLGLLSQYFTLEEISTTDTINAYLYALGLTLISICLTFINGIVGFYGYKLSMLVRIVTCSAIYQKIVKLSPARVNQLTVGHLLNLASNDVHRFDQALLFYNFLWIAPIHLAVVTYFMYAEIGPSAFIGTTLIIIQVPLQHIFSQCFIKLRLKAAKLTDSRILIMNEIISGIRVIKMYGWEYAFHELVANIRRKEVQAILHSSIFRIISLSYFSLSIPTMMFAMFSVYVSLDENNILTAKKVFTTLSLLATVRLVSLVFLVKAVVQLSEGRVALKRISKFLLSQEKDIISSEPSSDDKESSGVTLIKMRNFKRKKSSLSSRNSASLLLKSVQDEEEEDDESDSIIHVHVDKGLVRELDGTCIVVDVLTASWSMNESDVQTLSNVSFNVDKSKPLLAVIGSVGAGKSTLLQCILNELSPLSGMVTVRGSLAYVSQEPWIFSDTLRANVLFGLEYDPHWYSTVIDACALDKDIDQLIDGDLTLIGERGVTLSGGQKARINLARAVYRKADIYLLDDPLSAVDAAVSRHIFDRCIKGLLSECCIVLVTHQLQYLQQCDQILGLKEGCVTVYGDSTEILSKSIDILTMIGGKEKEGGEENDTADNRVYAIRKYSYDNILSSDGEDKLSVATINKEEIESESLSSNKSCDHHVTSTTEDKTDQDVKIRPPEEKAQGTISLKTYYRYFVIGGGYVFTGVVFAMFIIAECCVVSTDWWMADWANCNKDTINATTSRCYLPDNQRIGIYFSLLSSVWTSCILTSILFYVLSLRAARILHNKMFNSIIRAPILFFDTNTSGRILNRFSKDIGFLDDILIYIFCEYLQRLCRFLSIMITAIIANYYLSIMVVILSMGFLLFRWYYLKTARDIKRIEALSRSPLYSHISMTLQGLVTIRAYNMVQSMMNEFHKYHNKHTQAWYLYIVSARWFGMRIDLISSIFVAGVAFVSIPLATSLNSGLVGLALTYAITLSGMFQYCVRLSTEVESYMVSTERVLAYGEDVQSEAPLESDSLTKPCSEWPQRGDIELNNVSYKHSKETPLVLKEISTVIKSGEKVGIVGRTGAGKSSLIAALFRLAEPSGSIRIDGIETTSLGLHDIRTKLSIIPQDPVLFTGTIRYNLDPFNRYADDDIWRALEHVQLKFAVECLEKGLESAVSEGGGNFSVGQRQLFCLARALLRNNKILIMDEATANVDLETDAIIQVVIRDKFKDCTVLTIAHRLDTVMDSDKIMVLRFGELIEYGIPHLLLSNHDSYLLRLVEHTGPVAAQRLKEIALLAYNNNSSSRQH